MALWPWCEPVIQPTKCSHCGNEQPVSGKKIIVCSCEGARQAETEERERQAAWVREQASKPKGRKAKIQ